MSLFSHRPESDHNSEKESIPQSKPLISFTNHFSINISEEMVIKLLEVKKHLIMIGIGILSSSLTILLVGVVEVNSQKVSPSDTSTPIESPVQSEGVRSLSEPSK